MPRGVYIRTKEHRRKLSEVFRGRKFPEEEYPNYGMRRKRHSKETIEKQSESRFKLYENPKERDKLSEAAKGKKYSKEEYPNRGMRGKTHSEEGKRKMSEAHKGKKLSEKHKRKLSKTHKQIELTEEDIERMSEAFKGEKNPMWKGGISFEPYSIDWTETLRRSIRERDHYICQLCNKYGNTVHHIDYNKRNCNPENLITLCCNCNSKINANRGYWTKYFKRLFKKAVVLYG